MDIKFLPFYNFIKTNTISATRSRYADSEIKSFEIKDNHISARVWGTNKYIVEISYDQSTVTYAYCSCPYDKGGYCKHIVNVLVRADHEIAPRINVSPAPKKIVSLDTPKIAELKVKTLSYTASNRARIKDRLLPQIQLPKNSVNKAVDFVVIQESAYHSKLDIFLCQATSTKLDEIKAPVRIINQYSTRIKESKSNEEIFFYNFFSLKQSEHEIELCKDLLKNPVGLKFFNYLFSYYPETINPKQLQEISPSPISPPIEIRIREAEEYYILICQIHFKDEIVSSKSIRPFGNFYLYKDTLYCFDNEYERRVMIFLAENNHEIYLRREHFESFKTDFLYPLENNVTVSYSFIEVAPNSLIEQKIRSTSIKKLIYLSELDNFILITPMVVYGEVEVPLLSKRALHIQNDDGTIYVADRDEVLEMQFLSKIQIAHKSFSVRPQTDFYYLHKNEFLDEGWFLNTFETWQKEGYLILGFNQIKKNRYNPHKISVKTSLQSGIDWFDIHASVSFGDQQVSLKQLQKSVLNKSRYIELGNGTQGLLPKEWLEKFDRYFRTGEIKENVIRSHKSNFQLIDELFDSEVLPQDIQHELIQYKEKVAGFQFIDKVNIPKKLKAKLRDYQKEGLNWLNFLDEFGFGGCLADDMGLGKTVQIIAYILTQHEKGNKGTNLIILPTSLLFNWKKELDKFAPSLKYCIHYGSNRATDKLVIKDWDIILTTYGIMLSDIAFFKIKEFNIIVLDESQAIKNPDSKRYKAARLLQGRQRIVVTGTPIENNTFDLYAQLSFAVPGLLGTAKCFATDYSTPIDKFQDSIRAQELQRRIHPFILRRTKNQVAKELPSKTEMIHYCEMGAEQRKVYDTYKSEFQKYLNGLEETDLPSASLHILQGLTKLRQICNSPSLLSDAEYYGNQSAKLEELLHQIKSLKDAHKILIFSQFIGMLDLIKEKLQEEGIGYAYLTGKTKNREAEVARFQQDENARVFLISLKAGGTGLNLTQAEYVFLVDPWWNPAVENQAIDRAYRIGQMNKVVAVRFITPDSIEEKIIELQQRKKQLAEDLIHTDNNILKSLNKNDLMNLL